MSMQKNDILARWRQVQAEIAAAAGPTQTINLVVVSKMQGPAQIEVLLQAGQRVFGENRVQEAQKKWPPLKRTYPQCALHLVGPLQSNKAAVAVQLFDAIHTLDRPKLARKLAELRDDGAVLPHLFVQVNTGAEPQKSGVLPQELDAFLRDCHETFALKIDGLMCLPPRHAAPSPHFSLLGKLAAQHGIKNLSMGMSGDFRAAIALGATHIRLGTKIFGVRD